MTLTTLDKNFLYSIAIEKAQWHNRDEGKLEDCISFELNNFDDVCAYRSKVLKYLLRQHLL